MSPLLAMDTSTGLGSVAVGRSGELLAEVVAGVRARHAESLLPAVDRALELAGVELNAIEGLVVGAGPGSFTGVRIAAATARGLVRVLGVPLFGYSGLAAVAAGVGAGDRPVCALFDARRGEVYAACYRFPGFASIETLMAPAALALDEVLSRYGANGSGDPPAIFAGEGALRHRAAIAAGGAVIAPPHLSVPRAGALLWLASLDPAAGRIEQPADWEPSYVREGGPPRAPKSRQKPPPKAESASDAD